jgi:flagellar biosynthesis protein FliR
VTELTPLARIGLLLLRPGMLVATAPAFGFGFAPPAVRLGVLLIMALSLMPVVPLPDELNPAAIAVIALRETLIGMALAMSVRLVMAAAELAGHLAGFQLGFSYASLVDPLSGARNNMLAAFYGMIALFMFLAIDAHHEMLRALASSYEELPIGVGALGSDMAVLVARVLGVIFSVGVQLAAPVVLVLVIVEVMLGVMARSMPSLNLMVSGAPVRLLVGMVALAATLQLLPVVIKGMVGPAIELAGRLAAAFR